MKNYDEELKKLIQKYKKRWYYYLSAIIVIVCIAIIVTKKTDTYWQNKYKEYPVLMKNDTLNGKILKYFSERGYCYIVVADSIKYRVEYSENYKYKPYVFCDFIQIGDSLFKKKLSDTLYIYRNDEKYYFEIGKLY